MQVICKFVALRGKQYKTESTMTVSSVFFYFARFYFVAHVQRRI